MQTKISTLIATVFHVGYAKRAPGTWGSLAGVALAWPVLAYNGTLGLLFGAVILFFVGWWAAGNYERHTGKHDSREIVIDEVVGQWLTISLGALGAVATRLIFTDGRDQTQSYLQSFLDIVTLLDEAIQRCLGDLLHGRFDYDTGLLTAYALACFVLFRLFDIWKPLHIGRVDRNVHGGLGTMLDDALAGLVAAVAATLLAMASYSFFFSAMTD